MTVSNGAGESKAPWTELYLCDCCDYCGRRAVRVTGAFGQMYPIPSSILSVARAMAVATIRASVKGNQVIANNEDGSLSYTVPDSAFNMLDRLPSIYCEFHGMAV